MRIKLLVAAILAAVALLAPTSATAARAPAHRCQSTTTSGRLVAGPQTSCAFARRVEKHVNASGIPRVVRLRSPVTGRRYTLRRTSANRRGYTYRANAGLWVHEVY